MLSRDRVIQKIKENPNPTVLIIGAGINGIGTFRDLSLQGINCLIVDRGDFCSGASMASSHMLHGGIRYLENGEFRLVREALHERNNLLRNAPHLTRPMPTAMPIFKWLSGLLNAPLKFIGLLTKPAERGAVIIKLGMMMYDFFVRDDNQMPNHRIYNKKEALEIWPEINPDLLFAATYFDGCMLSPERLALEILIDGEGEGTHARAINYLSAIGKDGDQILLRDELSGEIIPVCPEIIINAGGPWIDAINQEIAVGSQFIGGTKGSHIIFDHPQLRKAIGEYEFFFEHVDGRIVLIFPYFENKVMIGTTDLRIDDPDQAVCSEDEVDYILGMIPQLFPDLTVTRDHIIFQFSGVRPLPVAKGSTGQISRNHSIEMIAQNDQNRWPILNLVGGKWTSYRAFSEQVTDKVLTSLNHRRTESTTKLKIGGGKSYPPEDSEKEAWIEALSKEKSISEARARTLFTRYGTRASVVSTYLSAKGDKSLKHLDGYSINEIKYLVEEEMVSRLDDLLLRRTKTAWVGLVTAESLKELAGIVGSILGWTKSQMNEELERCTAILKEKHGLRL